MVNVLIFFAGLVLLTVGLWLYSPPLALSVLGIGLMLLAVVSAVLSAATKKGQKK